MRAPRQRRHTVGAARAGGPRTARPSRRRRARSGWRRSSARAGRAPCAAVTAQGHARPGRRGRRRGVVDDGAASERGHAAGPGQGMHRHERLRCQVDLCHVRRREQERDAFGGGHGDARPGRRQGERLGRPPGAVVERGHSRPYQATWCAGVGSSQRVRPRASTTRTAGPASATSPRGWSATSTQSGKGIRRIQTTRASRPGPEATTRRSVPRRRHALCGLGRSSSTSGVDARHTQAAPPPRKSTRNTPNSRSTVAAATSS